MRVLIGKPLLLSCFIGLFLPGKACAEAFTQQQQDRAFACTYMKLKGGALQDGLPEPCQYFIASSASMIDQPTLRSLQIFIKAKWLPEPGETLLREYMTLPKDALRKLANDPYFIAGFGVAMSSLVQAKRDGKNVSSDAAVFAKDFYVDAFSLADYEALGNAKVLLSIYAAWFVHCIEHDLAIDVLEKIKSEAVNNADELGAYFSIFSGARILDVKEGGKFLSRMKTHFGELDWRTVYALTSAVNQGEYVSRIFRPPSMTEPEPNRDIDLWPIMSAWVESDILSAAPDAALIIMIGEAGRLFYMKKYEQSMKIIEYVLGSPIVRAEAGRKMYLIQATDLASRIIVSEKRYGDLRPFLYRHRQWNATEGLSLGRQN